MADWQTVTELDDLREDLEIFSQKIIGLARRLGLELGSLSADHISVRCHQNTTAERWQNGLLQCGTCFSDSMIKGRPVKLFRLNTPLQLAPWSFSVIELPWPGEKRYPHEGWEHIEIVLSGEPDTLAARALSLLSDEGLRQPDIFVKSSCPDAKGDILPNPTLAVTDGCVTIKFHPWAIEDVVASEVSGA